MASFTLVAQNVNGDPSTSGANINIVANSYTTLTFSDFDNLFGTVSAGDWVSLDGGITQLSYEFLGFGFVRNDTSQFAGFVRVETSPGVYQTFAIDMNADNDFTPNLQQGNTKLDTASLVTGSYSFPVCFTPGIAIRTAKGLRPIETLAPGDMVWTLDHGFQPLVELRQQQFAARGRTAPVRFAAEAWANSQPFELSQQHRVLLTGWQAEILFGAPEVLVAARHLVNGTTITLREQGAVDYLHLVLERHEIVEAGGILTESFYPDHELAFGGTTDMAAPLVRPQIRGRDAAIIGGLGHRALPLAA